MYRLADQSWRNQPKFMSLGVASRLGARISEHLLKHGHKVALISLHGGEPLLAGTEFLDKFCETISAASAGIDLRFAMQTNGTLFDEGALELCKKWRINVGLSFDGPRQANDRHRVDFAGKSSFDATERGLRLLSSKEGRDIWGGVLTVIDLQNSPLELYSYLRSYSPPSIDFLLPLGNHDAKPQPYNIQLGKATTPYADWLLSIFQAWFSERPQTTKIRKFSDIINLLSGGIRSSEEWGLGPKSLIVVETDGSIEGVDTLKSAFEGAARLGLDVFRNTFDEVVAAPSVQERLHGSDSLCSQCRGCELVSVCGAGYLPHRYSKANGFQNPSVYCADLTKLIREIHRTVSAYLGSVASADTAVVA